MKLLILLTFISVFLFSETFVYSRQPPPPPLDVKEFKKLVLKSDLIIVGKIEKVNETFSRKGELQKTIEVTVKVEKNLTRGNCGQYVSVRENLPTFRSEKTLSLPGVHTESEPDQTFTVSRAGPSFYHGSYLPGDRIILLLEHTEKTCQFRPLGSGSYDKHLCEFLITNNGIKALYFNFASDLEHYTGFEKTFIQLIESFITPVFK